MSYVLVNNDNGRYVAPGGQESSYTTKLEHAKTYPTREAAEKDACGNERAVPVDSLMRG